LLINVYGKGISGCKLVRKIWKFKNESVKPETVKNAAEQYGLPPLIANVMLNRDIAPQDFETFLAKSKRNIKNPMTMLDAEKAAERIITALRNKEKIVIYGDYDVDGITSTALLYDFLKSLGADVIFYIPDRFDEGYGINIMAVNKFIKNGIKLLITVDCGITAIGEVEFAQLQGLDVIITDHHTCKERIPSAACAVVNPKREDDESEFKSLAGVGVTFKLVLALAIKLGMNTGECFDRYCDLAAIGTIADVVPLTDENRIIVDKGLKQLQNPKRPGIKELFSVAGIADKKITAASVAFSLAPRMNAAGRLGTAVTAVELLLTTDETKAKSIAEELDRENTLRRETEQEIVEEAVAMIAADSEFDKKKVIVLARNGWHTGVIGIVASRLTEMYYKPCILISLSGGKGKGSGRSIEGFNLFDALSDSDSLLTTFGGHSAAAGLGINESELAEFEQKINRYADTVLKTEDMVPIVKIDRLLRGVELNIALAKQLSMLEPYGMGNEKPVFAVKNAVVESILTVGVDGKHLKIGIEKDGIKAECIGFGLGECASEIKQGDKIHIAFRLDINAYQGRESLQLVLNDIKTAVE
jgi:single-stranded-DNA-specific exonuclease